MEEHCPLFIDSTKIPRDRLAEISGPAVAGTSQRPQNDPFQPASPDDGCEASGGPWLADRRRGDIFLGLYRELYRATKRLGITHWYAFMEDKLWTLLRRFRFVFDPIGPYVNYHGRRAPFLAEVSAVEHALRVRSPNIAQAFSAGL